jgi:magnesium-transporting ATPase (P-type)
MFFLTGMKILIFLGFIFFFIFWYLSNIWTAPGHLRLGVPKEKRDPLRAMIVSLFVTFKFFFIGIIILGILSLIFRFLPDLTRIFKP